MDGTDGKSFFYNGTITFGLIEFRIIHFDDVMKFLLFQEGDAAVADAVANVGMTMISYCLRLLFSIYFLTPWWREYQAKRWCAAAYPHLMMGLSHSLTQKKKRKTVNAVVMCKPACVLETLLIVAVLQPVDVLRYLQRKLKKTQNQSKKDGSFHFLRDETWCCWTIFFCFFFFFSSFESGTSGCCVRYTHTQRGYNCWELPQPKSVLRH